MSAVFNRFGARGADEDVAMRFEIACALSSKIRIADGGQDLAALMAFGRADEAVGQTSAFATSVREATREMLVSALGAIWSPTVQRAPNARVSAFPGRARVISDEPANED